MMILNKDGMLALDDLVERVGGRTNHAIELPADPLEQQSDLLDRVFAFASDVLGLHTPLKAQALTTHAPWMTSATGIR